MNFVEGNSQVIDSFMRENQYIDILRPPLVATHRGTLTMCSSLQSSTLAVACCTDRDGPYWLTIMWSGRIDGKQEGGVCEILPELPVTDQRLWLGSLVIHPTLGLRPVTAGAAREEDAVRARQWPLTAEKLWLKLHIWVITWLDQTGTAR